VIEKCKDVAKTIPKDVLVCQASPKYILKVMATLFRFVSFEVIKTDTGNRIEQNRLSQLKQQYRAFK
jgi:hypothetical protein